MEPLKQRDLMEVLAYALGGEVPEGFLEHLLEHRDKWDPEFRRRLDAYAYELRPDLAVWEIMVDERGRLSERRVPLVS